MSLRRMAMLAVLGGLLLGCIRMSTRPAASSLSVGKPAPNITGVDAHGDRFQLSDYRGKVVLLDFWSSH